MRKFYWVIPALLFLAIGASPARADDFNWTYTGGSNTGSGTLTTGTFSGGSAAITSITGTFSGYAIDVLEGTGSWGNNDNILFYPGTPYLDVNGFTFSLTSGGGLVNIYYYSGTYQTYNDTLDNDFGTLTLTPVTTPEPGTLVLLLFGLVGLLLVRKRMARGLQPVT